MGRKKPVSQLDFEIQFINHAVSLKKDFCVKILTEIIQSIKPEHELIPRGSPVKENAAQIDLKSHGLGYTEILPDFNHIKPVAEILSEGIVRRKIVPFLQVETGTKFCEFIPEILLKKLIVLCLEFLSVKDDQRELTLQIKTESLIDLPAAKSIVHSPVNIIVGVVPDLAQKSFIPEKRDPES